MNIVLGVTGSIAAYKAADIISRLKKLGHNIDVILTESGSKIITPLTLQTLSKNKVYMDMFEEITPQEVKHISLAVYIAIGLDMDGHKDVLGMYVGQNESAKFWLSILNGHGSRAGRWRRWPGAVWPAVW